MNKINQYTSVTGVSSLGYFTRGDLTQFGDWTYTFDAAGNLIRAHNTQSNVLAKYWRDASGHRAVKDVDGAKTVFFNLGTNPLEAYNVQTDMTSSTIYEPGIDRPLAEESSSGTLTFYHQDWLGNVAMVSNSAGAKVQTYTYDVWGKPSGFGASGLSLPVSGFASRFLFTGREYDAETGLYHYRARAYSPTLGRFIQSDPIDFIAGDVNLLRYVFNNPVSWVDPLGLAPGDPYTSPDSAAEAALNDINPRSVQENVEYGGLIEKILDGPNAGCYTYTEPQTDNQPNWVRLPTPNPKTDAGSYHTHSGPVEGDLSSEYFSERDMDSADAYGTPAYLATPHGRFGKYTPWKLRSDGTQPNPRKGKESYSGPGRIKTK